MVPPQTNLIRALPALAQYQNGIQDIIEDLTNTNEDANGNVAIALSTQLVDRLTALLTRASEVLTRPATAFFDLPPELRNRIYDYIVGEICARMPVGGSNDRYCVMTYVPGRARAHAGLVNPLAQINKQVRTEFLARLHRIVELSFVASPNSSATSWLAVFGASRCLFSRSFCFNFGDDEVRVEWKGTPAARRATDASAKNTESQKERLKISSPQYLRQTMWAVQAGKARQKRTHDFEQRFKDLVEGLVIEKDVSVCLTSEGIAAICKYLRKQRVNT